MAARSHYGGFEFMPRPSQGYYGKVAQKVVSTRVTHHCHCTFCTLLHLPASGKSCGRMALHTQVCALSLALSLLGGVGLLCCIVSESAVWSLMLPGRADVMHVAFRVGVNQSIKQVGDNYLILGCALTYCAVLCVSG